MRNLYLAGNDNSSTPWDDQIMRKGLGCQLLHNASFCLVCKIVIVTITITIEIENHIILYLSVIA